MVNLLLAKGANINAFDKKDRRALHWAAYMGEDSVCGKQSASVVTSSMGGQVPSVHKTLVLIPNIKQQLKATSR